MIHYTTVVQSIIYCNEFTSLQKAAFALDNAAKNYERHNPEASLKLVWGDASPTPVLSESDVNSIKKSMDFLDFDYIYFGKNTGSAHGHNLLAKDANCDYLTIMNPDVIVPPNFFEAMFTSFNTVGVAMVEARQTPIEHQKEYDVNTFETEWATTACAMIRSDIYRELNGFDHDSFFLYCDDLDFSWRLRLAGHKIVYRPDVPVFHSKKLTLEGGWMPTNAEIYYSAYASMMMAYKWSNDERLEHLLKVLPTYGEVQKKAVNEFKQKMKDGSMPSRLDPEHRISKFIGDYYSENRFVL